jgi:hypothetical protein
MQKKDSSRKALNELFTTMGRSAGKSDYEKYTIINDDLNNLEDSKKLISIIRRYNSKILENPEEVMSIDDAREVRRIYAKLQ